MEILYFLFALANIVLMPFLSKTLVSSKKERHAVAAIAFGEAVTIPFTGLWHGALEKISDHSWRVPIHGCPDWVNNGGDNCANMDWGYQYDIAEIAFVACIITAAILAAFFIYLRSPVLLWTWWLTQCGIVVSFILILAPGFAGVGIAG